MKINFDAIKEQSPSRNPTCTQSTEMDGRNSLEFL